MSLVCVCISVHDGRAWGFAIVLHKICSSNIHFGYIKVMLP